MLYSQHKWWKKRETQKQTGRATGRTRYAHDKD